jgi:hypothetical protein
MYSHDPPRRNLSSHAGNGLEISQIPRILQTGDNVVRRDIRILAQNLFGGPPYVRPVRSAMTDVASTSIEPSSRGNESLLVVSPSVSEPKVREFALPMNEIATSASFAFADPDAVGSKYEYKTIEAPFKMELFKAKAPDFENLLNAE